MMSRSLDLAGIVAVLVLVAVGASSQSLPETVKEALSGDPAVASAESRLSAAQLRQQEALLAYWPTLTAGGGYQYLSTPPTMSLALPTGTKTVDLAQTNSIDLTAGAQWTVFDGFQREASAQMKADQSRLAGIDREAQRRNTALRTVAAYRSAQSARLQRETLRAARQQTELLLTQTQSLLAQGMAKEVDVLSLQLSLLDNQQKDLAAQAVYESALETLRSLTGHEIQVDPAPAGLDGMTLPELDLEALPQIEAWSFQKSLLRASRTAAKARDWPRVDATVVLHSGIPGNNPSENEWMTYATAGLQVSWAYSWGASGLEADAVGQTLVAAANDEAAARTQARQQFADAVRDWSSSRKQLDVLKAALDLATTKLAIVKTQYSQGQATSVAFNEATLSQAQASLSYRNQVLTLLLKASQLEALSGLRLEQWRTLQ